MAGKLLAISLLCSTLNMAATRKVPEKFCASEPCRARKWLAGRRVT